VLVGTWTKEIDRAKVARVLSGADPFDETMLADESVQESADTTSQPGDPTHVQPYASSTPIAAPERQVSPV
jgi:aerobic C4-dicarboxylate transport protein